MSLAFDVLLLSLAYILYVVTQDPSVWFFVVSFSSVLGLNGLGNTHIYSCCSFDCLAHRKW